MADGGRPFDIKPMIAMVAFSLALSAILIVLNSGGSTSDFAADGSRLVTKGDQSAELVDPQADPNNAPRQLGTPTTAPPVPAELGDELAIAAEAAGTVAANVTTTVAPADQAPQTTGTTIAPAPATTAAPEVAGAVQTTTTVAPRVTTTTSAPRATTTTTRQTATTTTTAAPRVTTTTAAPTTTTTAAPTTTRAPVNGRYSVAQIIDGTISAGDGSNPNEEAPMGRHDAPLYLPQAWNWAQGPTRNTAWGNLGTGSSRYAEWRCAVIPENGHNPPVPFRINVRNGAYWQFANNSWSKGFDVDLTKGHNGGYLGQAGRLNTDPFSAGGHGQIQWRREADGSFSAPWNSNALMMHFWAGQRKAPASGQTAEFLTSEVRLQQPDGQTVDLSQVKVLFQCGIDYYNTTGGQGTKVPGPGIAKYHRVTTSWKPGLWVTLPGGVPANSTADFRVWLEANLPPDVRP